MTYTEITIWKNILSDGSATFDVVLRQRTEIQGEADMVELVSLPAYSEEDANAMADGLRDTVIQHALIDDVEIDHRTRNS